MGFNYKKNINNKFEMPRNKSPFGMFTTNAADLVKPNLPEGKLVEFEPQQMQIGGGAMGLMGGLGKGLLKLGIGIFEGSMGKTRPPHELKKEFDVEKIKNLKI